MTTRVSSHRHRALIAVLSVSALWASSASAAATRITFYFGLKRPEAPAVRAFDAVQSPGSTSYRRFLTPTELSHRYVATAATRHAFVLAVHRLGLRAEIDRSGVFARVGGTVAELERVFAVRIKTAYSDDVHATSYFVPGGVCCTCHMGCVRSWPRWCRTTRGARRHPRRLRR